MRPSPPAGPGPGVAAAGPPQVVAFRGRARLLDQLPAWAREPGSRPACSTGPAGRARPGWPRTRRHSATSRWTSLWLRPDAAADALAVFAEAAVPLLVIIDYAETRPEQVSAAVRAAARHGGPAHRYGCCCWPGTAGDWWDSLPAAGHPHTSELLEGAPGRPTGRPRTPNLRAGRRPTGRPCTTSPPPYPECPASRALSATAPPPPPTS